MGGRHACAVECQKSIDLSCLRDGSSPSDCSRVIQYASHDCSSACSKPRARSLSKDHELLVEQEKKIRQELLKLRADFVERLAASNARREALEATHSEVCEELRGIVESKLSIGPFLVGVGHAGAHRVQELIAREATIRKDLVIMKDEHWKQQQCLEKEIADMERLHQSLCSKLGHDLSKTLNESSPSPREHMTSDKQDTGASNATWMLHQENDASATQIIYAEPPPPVEKAGDRVHVDQSRIQTNVDEVRRRVQERVALIKQEREDRLMQLPHAAKDAAGMRIRNPDGIWQAA